MAITVVCDVCGGEFPNANPGAFKKWEKHIKVRKRGKKCKFTISLEADDNDFDHICNDCARDIAKEIASEIVNA